MTQHLLLDIEGTTCPITFVSEILFPYAKRELSAYVTENVHNSGQNRSIQEARREWERDQSLESLRLKKQVSEQQINEVEGLIQYLKLTLALGQCRYLTVEPEYEKLNTIPLTPAFFDLQR